MVEVLLDAWCAADSRRDRVAELAAFLQSEIAKWGPVITEAKIKLEPGEDQRRAEEGTAEEPRAAAASKAEKARGRRKK